MTLPDFIPDFAKGGGLIAAIAQDAATLDVLMLAWMNEEAWRRTLETGEVHYYSRSRNELWHKGATSGHVQRVVSIRPDCDGDAVLVLVEQHGAACHEGYRSCFFRELRDGRAVVRARRLVDPGEVYGS
jgi:phosphoribosyl-AMP cyclohydrolase